jgi:hypothetical protein
MMDDRTRIFAMALVAGVVAFASVFHWEQGQLPAQQASAVPATSAPQASASQPVLLSQPTDEMNIRLPPQSFCDKGIFIVNGSPIQFEDIVVDGPKSLELNKDGKITVYGYLAPEYFRPHIVRQFAGSGAEIAAGNKCFLHYDKRVAVKTDEMVDMLFSEKNIPTDQYRQIKKKLLRATDGHALVKAAGHFGVYGDEDKLYFSADTLEIIDAPQ